MSDSKYISTNSINVPIYTLVYFKGLQMWGEAGSVRRLNVNSVPPTINNDFYLACDCFFLGKKEIL